MENVLKKLFVAALLCLMQTTVCTADTFKGKIVNAETGEILIGATVRSEINPQPGWSMQNSTETDSTGCFTLDSGWEGRIMITFSMIGYKNSRKVDYAYGPEVKDTTDLGTIRLQPTALMLQEVEVKAKVPRITMRGDTIVFNPEAFKLKEGAPRRAYQEAAGRAASRRQAILERQAHTPDDERQGHVRRRPNLRAAAG